MTLETTHDKIKNGEKELLNCYPKQFGGLVPSFDGLIPIVAFYEK